jgi:ABC-2 type transport system ATP-binding protein
MLHLERFRKLYNDFLVLKIDELRMAPGIYWIKGVNGSGKSTLLKTIAGILPFHGDIRVNNISIQRQPVAYRKLVNVAEASPIFPGFLTGTEMIRLFAAAKDAPPQQASFFIESMKMQAYIDEPLHIYSSGMLKKLSLVLAFLGNAEVILLDEPLVTLDAESLTILYTWITERHTQSGTTFLLSSHQALETHTIPAMRTLLVDQQTVTYI